MLFIIMVCLTVGLANSQRPNSLHFDNSNLLESHEKDLRHQFPGLEPAIRHAEKQEYLDQRSSSTDMAQHLHQGYQSGSICFPNSVKTALGIRLSGTPAEKTGLIDPNGNSMTSSHQSLSESAVYEEVTPVEKPCRQSWSHSTPARVLTQTSDVPPPDDSVSVTSHIYETIDDAANPGHVTRHASPGHASPGHASDASPTEPNKTSRPTSVSCDHLDAAPLSTNDSFADYVRNQMMVANPELAEDNSFDVTFQGAEAVDDRTVSHVTARKTSGDLHHQSDA
jgi:hypothetical protein